MFVQPDGNLLHAKIVATLGAAKAELTDSVTDRLRRFDSPEAYWEAFLSGFFVGEHCLIDVLRLNMSFFNPTQRTERHLLNCLRANKFKMRRVAVLGDLPGPKIRVRRLTQPLAVQRGEQIKLQFKSIEAQQGPAVCVYHKGLGDADSGLDVHLRERLTKNGSVPVHIGDGKVVLAITGITANYLDCVVEKSGTIFPGQGATLRGIPIALPAFQEDDRVALDFLLEEAINWQEDFYDPSSSQNFLAYIAVSFVQTKEDLINVRRYVEEWITNKLLTLSPHKPLPTVQQEARLLSPAIIAKIETEQARRNINEILDLADGLMVARGDLALQVGPQEVPGVQKSLIKLCNVRGKPVITATEMLASMEENPEPTRAEVNDVFNAILDGTDAVMLSAETSKGRYPYQAVAMMTKIAGAAERHVENFGGSEALEPKLRRQLTERRYEELLYGSESAAGETIIRLSQICDQARALNDQWLEEYLTEKIRVIRKQEITDRITLSACLLATSGLPVKAILAPTTSGRTVRMIARYRPRVLILPVTHDIMTRRKLLLSCGVYPLSSSFKKDAEHGRCNDVEEVFRISGRLAKAKGYVADSDVVVFIAGTPLLEPGTTNLIHIREIA